MNSPLPFLLSVAIASGIIGLISWFAADMRSMLKSNQRKTQLQIDGRWKDLEEHFKRAARTPRPFVWFYRKYLLPGNLDTQHALFLHKQGRLEEALAKADEAIWKVKAKPWIFRSIYRSGTLTTMRGALTTRTLSLTGLGRYDEAREAAAEYQSLPGSHDRPNAALALLEYNCGHLDEALAQAQAVSPGDNFYDSMRGVMALCYSMKGDFDQALEALSYEPANASKFYPAAGLKTLSESPEGAKLIALRHAKLARFFPPARFIKLAKVYIAREEFENADRALDQAEKSLGPEPGLQMSYCRARACSLAAREKSKEAEVYIERVRAIAREFPKRSFVWEMHFAAGRSYLYLRRFSDALAELTEARRSALHPIQKHAIAYWTAKAHEAAGDQHEAILSYEIVAADSIQSWMREQAAQALARLKG